MFRLIYGVITALFLVGRILNIVHATGIHNVILSLPLGFGFGWFGVRAVLGEP